MSEKAETKILTYAKHCWMEDLHTIADDPMILVGEGGLKDVRTELELFIEVGKELGFDFWQIVRDTRHPGELEKITNLYSGLQHMEEVE